nr:hypothetical protein [Tanacetum cinerariifolium]
MVCVIKHIPGTNESEGDQVHSPHDSPLSGGHTSGRAEGALNLEELFFICINLSNRVLALENDKKDKPKPTLDDSTFDADLDTDHGIDYMDTEEPVNEGRLSEKTEELVSTARPEDSTVRLDVSTTDPIAPPPTTTTSIFDDKDITMAQTLIKMKEEKAKEKGVSIKDIKDSSRPARSILTLKPLPTIDPKDKGKDVEVARLVYEEELAELEREKEKRQREEKASKAAIAKISAKIRSRPPTKSQLRNLMMTYLKNIGGYKHSQLKAKSFAEMQGLYERQKRVIDDFKPMNSDDAVDKEKILEEPDSTKVEVKKEGDEESIKKRPGKRLKMKATKKSKRQKTDSDLKEKEHLKTFLQYSRWIKTFSEMITRFDRMDIEELYNLVMQRFETTSPEGIDLVLWCNLRTMFEETADDDLWKYQEEWILKSWNFYENYGVQTLTLEDGTEIYIVAERRYPLTKETLKRMLALRLIAECESEAVFDLLRFIQKQVDKSRSYDGSEKDLKELASPKQMALALAIPEQTATDKETSNPFMAGWKLIKEKFKELQCVWMHPPGVQEAQDEET